MADRRRSSGRGTEVGDLRDTLQRSLSMRTTPLFFLVFPLMALFLMASCGNSGSGSGCIEVFDSGGSLIVSVGCGDPRTKPLYDWDFEKKVLAVEVLDPSKDDDIVWSLISTTNDNSINPPIQHGTVPIGATPVVETETKLEIGKRYIVRVFQLTGGEIGTIEFEILPE